MAIEHKLQKCAEDDPNRCQSPGAEGEGQCVFLAEPGSKKCLKHGAVQEQRKAEKAKINAYRLQIWQERVDEFSEGEEVKTLRGEIAILRLVTETILNQCKEKHELVLYSGKIGDLVMKIEKLVTSCDRLETKFGMLLDKSAALVLASQIVEIISKYEKDGTVIDAISSDIIGVLSQLGSDKNA
jgi:hypothetical protein